MARKTVDELTKEKLAALNQDTDAAHAVKKATMQDNVKTYNQQVDASVAQQTGIYEDNIRDVERAEKAQLDYNHIDELVARKNLENKMADMGTTDSGLNRSQQTAISVMRGNADSKTRQGAADKVQSLRDAIDQVMITGEQQKTAYQQEQSSALSEWYQDQLLVNKQNARTAAVEQYNAETEAIEKQQNAVRNNTAEMNTYAMTLIKEGVDPDEAWADAQYRYGAMSDKDALHYAAYKDGVSRGYTGDALEAYANAGGGAAGKAAVNEIKYGTYDNEIRAAGVNLEKQAKFHSAMGFNDWASTEAADITAAWVGNFGKGYNQSQWDKSIKRTVEQAEKNVNKTALSNEAKDYAVAVSVGRTLARVIEDRDKYAKGAKNALSTADAVVMMYNALGNVFNDDMLQVAAQAAGFTVED